MTTVPSDTRQGIIAMVSGGATYSDASAAFGVSRSSVAGLIRRAKIGGLVTPDNTGRWSADENTRAAEMFAAGAKAVEVAVALGRSEASIAKWRRKNGCARRAEPAPRSDAWSAADETTLREMFAAGETDATIGRAVSRTENSVFKKRKKLRLLRPRFVWGTKAGKAIGRAQAESRAHRMRAEAERIDDPNATDIWTAFETLRGCKFITGDPKAPAFSYCNRPGSPWCADHRALVYGGAPAEPPGPDRKMTRMQLRASVVAEQAT